MKLLYFSILFLFFTLISNISTAAPENYITYDMKNVQVNIHNNAKRPDIYIGYSIGLEGASSSGGWYGVNVNEFETYPVYMIDTPNQRIKIFGVGLTQNGGVSFVPSLPASCNKILNPGDTLKVTGRVDIYEHPKEPTAKLECLVTRAKN